MFTKYIKSLFRENTVATTTLATEKLQQAVGELFYHSNAFNLGTFPGATGLDATTPVKATRARIFLAGFTEALKHVKSTESITDIAGKIHTAMMAVWQDVPRPSDIYDAMKQEFDYRLVPYNDLNTIHARVFLTKITEAMKPVESTDSVFDIAVKIHTAMMTVWREIPHTTEMYDAIMRQDFIYYTGPYSEKKSKLARVFQAGFKEALKYIETADHYTFIAGKIHTAMKAVYCEKPHPSEKQEFDYYVGPYNELKSKSARAEPIFILLALRELAKATPNDVSTDTIADRADALLLASYRSMVR